MLKMPFLAVVNYIVNNWEFINMKKTLSILVATALLGASSAAVAAGPSKMYAGGSLGWLVNGNITGDSGSNSDTDDLGIQGTFGYTFYAKQKQGDDFASRFHMDAQAHVLVPTGSNAKDLYISGGLGARIHAMDKMDVLTHIGLGYSIGNENKSAKNRLIPFVDFGMEYRIVDNIGITGTFTHFSGGTGIAQDMLSAGAVVHF